jgi:hypothetical protein
LNRGLEKLKYPNQIGGKAGRFDALGQTGAAKFPSLQWIRATIAAFHSWKAAKRPGNSRGFAANDGFAGIPERFTDASR